MNRRKLRNSRHKFIKRHTFASKNNFLTTLRKDLKVELKLEEVLDNKAEVLEETRFPQKEEQKEIRSIKKEKVKNSRMIKSLRQMIDDEESKLDEIDSEETTLDLLDKLEEIEN